MKPGEPMRFICDECLIAFDIVVAPRQQWPELPDESDLDVDVEVLEDAACPFCGAANLKMRPGIFISLAEDSDGADEDSPANNP